jgi:nucleoside-diphosphate-sugar epimerase
MSAAVAAGVRRVIYAGTLEIFAPYPDDVYISERWRPLPSHETGQIARYLGEFVCREFSRAHFITATSLRLGKLTCEDEVKDHTPDPMWVDYRDAAQAFACALRRDNSNDPMWTRRWEVYHICADIATPKYLIEHAARIGYHPQHSFGESWRAKRGCGLALSPAEPPLRAASKPTPVRKVLFLGASGKIGPNIIPQLGEHYDLALADVLPYPDGRPIQTVDVTDYGQVLEAARGMDAILNFTVNRSDPVESFNVNIVGAYHVMRVAAELGIRRVLHTGPQLTISAFTHDFEIDDVPRTPGTSYYGLTKYLSYELCRAYARNYGIQTPCFVFNGLHPKPPASVLKQDFPPFTIVWEDLVHACRLALEVESIPDDFQDFNLLSYLAHGKYRIDKAKRMLGYEPLERVEDYYKRPIDG